MLGRLPSVVTHVVISFGHLLRWLPGHLQSTFSQLFGYPVSPSRRVVHFFSVLVIPIRAAD